MTRHPCGAAICIDAGELDTALQALLEDETYVATGLVWGGAIRTITATDEVGRYGPSGALYVKEGVVRPFSGAQGITIVDGSSYTGLHAPDGTWNVVYIDAPEVPE